MKPKYRMTSWWWGNYVHRVKGHWEYQDGKRLEGEIDPLTHPDFVPYLEERDGVEAGKEWMTEFEYAYERQKRSTPVISKDWIV